MNAFCKLRGCIDRLLSDATLLPRTFPSLSGFDQIREVHGVAGGNLIIVESYLLFGILKMVYSFHLKQL